MYLLRDRGAIYGEESTGAVRNLGTREVMTAPRRPWQNPDVERLVGSIRRECVDHVVVLGEDHLRRVLKKYSRYYHRSRTHLSLGMNAPESRPTQPAQLGDVVQIPEIGGLHHRYERRAA